MQTHAADGPFDNVGAETSQNSVEVFKITERRLTKVDNIQVGDFGKTTIYGVDSTKGKISVYDFRKCQGIQTFQDELDDWMINQNQSHL